MRELLLTVVTRMGALLIAAALAILAVGLLRSASQGHAREPPCSPKCLEGVFSEVH